MTYVIGLPLLALAAVLQATVLANLRLLGGTLDLVLLLTLGWTLAGGWQSGMVWGLIGGLALDLLSGAPLGTTALGLVLVAYFTSLTEGRFWRSHVLLPLGTVLIATLVFHGVVLLVLTAAGFPIPLGPGLARVTLPALLLNTLLMLPVYHVLRWLHAVFFPPLVHL